MQTRNMTTIGEQIHAYAQIGQLGNAMGWDEKHGPTEEQWDAFMVLFPDVDTSPNPTLCDLNTLTLHPVV